MTGSLTTGGRADPDGADATIGGASTDAAAGAVTGGAGGTAFAGGVDDDDADAPLHTDGADAFDGVAVDAFGVPLALALDFALDLPWPLPGIFGGGTPGMPPGGTAFRYRQLLP